MRFVVVPRSDSENTKAPDVTFSFLEDGSLEIVFMQPYRRVVIEKKDWMLIRSSHSGELEAVLVPRSSKPDLP